MPETHDGPFYGYGFVGLTLSDARIPVDTNSLTDCRLDRVTLVCAGRASGTVARCTFSASKVLFTGPAANVIRQLRTLYRASPEQADRINDLMKAVRRGGDFRAAARLASWEYLRSDPASRVLSFLRDVAGSGSTGRQLFDSFVADLRSPDSQLIAAEDLTPEEAAGRSFDPALSNGEGRRLRIRVAHPEWADPDVISTGIADLVSALDAYHRAIGGSGLEVDDTHGTGSAVVNAAVTA